jgi:general transcription factor 3C polypeptide 3 (transcription factor C subunit 4)
MDPLRFAEEDETGKLPYEQFQRLEYEALAARKRKTLASRRE